MEVRVVRCGDYRLRVTTWGHGSPHAVVLPGLSADARSLAPQIRELRRLYPSVHVIDLPGSAYRPALLVKDAKFSQLAEYVVAVMDAVGAGRATLVGHSLGGGVALHLALAHRERVESLVLIAPAALGRSLHWIYKLYCLPLIGRALLRPQQQRMSKTFLRRFLVGSSRGHDDHFLELLIRHSSDSRDRALTSRAIVWANQPPWWKRVLLLLTPGGEQMAFSVIDRIDALDSTPTLVLWGNEDRVICWRDALRIKDHHERTEVHIARAMGHMLPLEAPAWTNERIRAFCQLRWPALDKAA
ncbi:MAG TPA: alpha/beta fold hydrolase [Candidatus Acidoferrales bacterium]|nr:alpha/beta fold hydrolase [Candidatus Acidoferrales bacterium]